MGYTHVKGHYIKRNGKRIWIKPHTMRVTRSAEKGRSGKRFKSLENRVEREYIRKGYSRARARQIARATAGKVFWEKYGKRKGKRILRRER